ncbi:hypothetical protein D3C83_274540 [compost metagenome]
MNAFSVPVLVGTGEEMNMSSMALPSVGASSALAIWTMYHPAIPPRPVPLFRRYSSR